MSEEKVFYRIIVHFIPTDTTHTIHETKDLNDAISIVSRLITLSKMRIIYLEKVPEVEKK